VPILRCADESQNPTGQSSLTEAGQASRRWRLKFAVLGGSIIISLVALDVGLRIFYAASQLQDTAHLGYSYDAELGWFPRTNSQIQITASRPITARHNSDGLRGPERTASHKPVILFLGDSLVWGFDAETSERFTEKLQAGHPEWAIYNFGVSGYGTDQEYLLLKRYYGRYHPRLVFLIICGDNDNDDNAWNFRGGYYKPYFRLEQGYLRLQGTPVPKSEKTFFAEHKTLSRSFILRALIHGYYKHKGPRPVKNQDPPTGALLLDMRKYVVERGGLFAVGLQRSNRELEDFLQKFQIPWVDLTTTNSAHTYREFGNHWTPEGHSFVAAQIDEFLQKHRAIIGTN